jgi:hypothetical protein
VAIGRFNDEFGEELYMIEERTGDGHSDKAGFGFADQMISTYDLLEELREDEDHSVDEKAYLKARLFDMLIGDWDRHYDQWRWAKFKENGKTVYRPVPRDRDQAFSLMDDGFLMRTATWFVPPIRLLRSYDAELKDPKWFNVEPYPLDVALLSTVPREEWIAQAEFLQNAIDEETIDRAFLSFPEEVRDHTIDTIKSKLLGRKLILRDLAEAYFEVVNRFAIITGTDKDDYFEIDRKANGATEVSVYRILKGQKEKRFKHRIFYPEENREIWIYGLDDKDYFEVKGANKADIKIRLIGGQNKDSYDLKTGRGIHIYDFKSEESVFLGERGHRHLKDDYYTNFYDYKKVSYNSRVIIPTVGWNPDDGLRVGFDGTVNLKGFNNENFSSSHSFGGHVYFATGGFDVTYTGEFAEVLPKFNLSFDARITSPNFAVNFFGFGNSTPNPSAGEDSEEEEIENNFNRVRQSNLEIGTSLIKRGDYGSVLSIGIKYHAIGIENTEGRFINEFLTTPGDPPTDQFFNAEFNYRFTNTDNPAYPTLGLDYNLTLGYNNNLKNSKDFSYLISWLGITLKIDAVGKLVFASKVGTQFNFGDDFEFYQAASIGANNGLRGFRNERFSGNRSFYHSSDLRYNLKRAKTALLPIEYGLYLGFDYGRVWVGDELVENPSFNSDRLNTSIGGGFFLNLVDTLAANVGLFGSSDSLRFSFGFGFGF